MPLINYQKWKADKVKAGKSKQTIRKLRKRRFRVGDKLFHYVGARTKNCQKLGESICSEVHTISIHPNLEIYINNIFAQKTEIDKIARLDGFKNTTEFIAFFINTHSLPFYGQIVRWKEINNDE